MKGIKNAKRYAVEIGRCLDQNPSLSNVKIAEKLVKELDLSIAATSFRHSIAAYRKEVVVPKIASNLGVERVEAKAEVKKGLELRDDVITINWNNRTIITDLGDYGNYVASFDRHNLIQRAYVYEHGNETAAVVAMEFDFPHTKAVYIYAKHHGFSKASPGQTDLEFEMGLTEEEAVDENIQKLKRDVYKKTQKRKWKETLDAASKWWNFNNTIIESIKALDIKGEDLLKLPSIIQTNQVEDFAAVMGITDVHYLKLCYNHKGEVVYDRKIALERLKEHITGLANHIARYGTPDEFIVMMGNDNIHVDGTHHSTTKLTSQHQATDGLWRLEFKNYVQMQIDYINYLKNISKITVLPVKGNHDYETSIALQAFLSIYFAEDPMVTVIECHDDRVYYQYGSNCFMATHGDELGSVANLERKSHQLILGEAKAQGIDIMEVKKYFILHGHEHKESTNDLNGNVERIGFKSLSGEDDFWHKKSGYTGRSKGSMALLVKRDVDKLAQLYI